MEPTPLVDLIDLIVPPAYFNAKMSEATVDGLGNRVGVGVEGGMRIISQEEELEFKSIIRSLLDDMNRKRHFEGGDLSSGYKIETE